MKKIEIKNRPTLATLKSFLNKNAEIVLHKTKSHFNGMVDMVTDTDDVLTPLTRYEGSNPENMLKRNLGFNYVWCVGGGRDYITVINDEKYIGYNVYNSCGEFDVVIEKNENLSITIK